MQAAAYSFHAVDAGGHEALKMREQAARHLINTARKKTAVRN